MYGLRSRSMEISGRVDTHIHHVRDIETIMRLRHGNRRTRETTISLLGQNLRRTKRKADAMTAEVETAETNISGQLAHLQETVQGLQTQMTKIHDHTKSQKIEAALHTGQTAYNFEKDLAAYIYPPGKAITYGHTFTNLMDWLRKNRKTREGMKGNKKWRTFKKKFGWSHRHKAVFLKMVKCRLTYAHPAPIDFTLPIPGDFSSGEKEHVEDIRKMAKWLNNQYKP